MCNHTNIKLKSIKYNSSLVKTKIKYLCSDCNKSALITIKHKSKSKQIYGESSIALAHLNQLGKGSKLALGKLDK